MPERLYLIGTDGRVVYKGGMGPMFFRPAEWREAALAIAFAYAALILSFLGGMWWGIAAAAPAAQRRKALGWLWIAAVLPSLVALACFLPWALDWAWPEPSLVMLGGALLVTLGVDAKLGALAPRCASRGVKRRASATIGSAASSRRAVRSSRTQKERPCVATTRSPRCTSRSMIGVAGRFIRSGCQRTPSSNEAKMPNSVPAYKTWEFLGSCLTTFTLPNEGRSLVRDSHVAPKSRVT
jgi:hypothetical protein